MWTNISASSSLLVANGVGIAAGVKHFLVTDRREERGRNDDGRR
jgi:hypothetical protein